MRKYVKLMGVWAKLYCIVTGYYAVTEWKWPNSPHTLSDYALQSHHSFYPFTQ